MTSSDEDNNFTKAYYGTLEGRMQTVPRAELKASLVAVQRFAGPLALYSDCGYVVKGLAKPLQWKLGSGNSDLWKQLDQALNNRGDPVSIMKVKAHAGGNRHH